MKKISSEYILFYFLVGVALCLTWGALHFQNPAWNLVVPYLGALGLLWVTWYKRLSKMFWFATLLSLLTVCVIVMTSGSQRGLIFVLMETVFLLLWDQKTELPRRTLTFLALAFVGFVAFDFHNPLLNSIAVSTFVVGRVLLWPEAKEDDVNQEFLNLWFVVVAVSTVMMFSNVEVSREALIAVSIAVLVACVFGKPVEALVGASFVSVELEPTLLFVLGPLVALLSAGGWGYRITSIFLSGLSIPILMKTQEIESIVAIGIGSFALGFLWWTVRVTKPRWPDFSIAAIATGVAVYLNQDWFFNLPTIANPMEVAGVGSWIFGFALSAVFRKRWKPVRLPSLKFKRPTWSVRWPRISWRPPQVSPAFSGYYFFIFVLLILTVAIMWGAQPLYDSL